MGFGLSTSRNGVIREVGPLGFEQNHKIGEATKVHRRNELVDIPSCTWILFGSSTSRNGAIGKVVPLGFEQQQEIGEATKVH
jgi:hypothetical protein